MRQRRGHARRKCAFNTLADKDLIIHWGAYLGTSDEIIISGRLGDVGEEIERTREEARRNKGWIMDTYMLRKPAKTIKPYCLYPASISTCNALHMRGRRSRRCALDRAKKR